MLHAIFLHAIFRHIIKVIDGVLSLTASGDWAGVAMQL
jgi:hypothetical protein